MTGPQAAVPLPEGLPLVRATLPVWRAAIAPRVPPTAVLALGWIVLVVVGTVQEPFSCTDAAPCGPDWYGSVQVGLGLALLLWCFWQPRWALAAGVPFGLLLLVDAALLPPGVSPLLVLGALVVLAGLSVLAGRLLDGQHDAAEELVAAAPHARWPAPAPEVAGGWRTPTGLLLLALALGVTAYGVLDGRGERAREDAAARVPGTVVAAADDGYSLDVRLDGALVRLDTLDAQQHPVGSEVLVLRGQGLDRLAAEPYDASGWGVLGVLLAAVGATLVVSGRRRVAQVRALLAEPQPVYRVAVVRSAGDAVLVPADAAVGPGALSRLPVIAVARDVLEDAADHDDLDDDLDDLDLGGDHVDLHGETDTELLAFGQPAPRLPARVLGLPLPGRQVLALLDDDTVLLPVGPVRRVPADWAPPFEPRTEPASAERLPIAGPAAEPAGSHDAPDADALDALLAPSPWRRRLGWLYLLAGGALALAAGLAVDGRGSVLLAALSAAQLTAAGLWHVTSEVRAEAGALRIRGPVRDLVAPWPSLAGADVVERVVVLRTRTGAVVPLTGARVPIGGRQARERARRRAADALQAQITRTAHWPSGALPSSHSRPDASLAAAGFVLLVALGLVLRSSS